MAFPPAFSAAVRLYPVRVRTKLDPDKSSTVISPLF
jgi:hypothetical protein